MSDDAHDEAQCEEIMTFAWRESARLRAERNAARDLAFRAAFARDDLIGYDEYLYGYVTRQDTEDVQDQFEARPSLDTLLGFTPEGAGE